MTTFTKTFIKIYAPTLEAMGFKRKRGIFHRLVNDQIVQVLSYKIYSRIDFDIQFDFWPLCNGYDMNVFMDSSYLLHSFAKEMGDRYWFYRDEASWEDDLYESLEYCRKYIFRYFDEISDYQSCYEIIYKMEEEQGAFRIKPEIPNLYLVPFHDIFLATQQYDLALQAYEARLMLHKRAMKAYSNDEDWDVSKHIHYPQYVEHVEYYENLKVLVDRHDYEAIEQIVKQKEEYSKKCYEKNFLGYKEKDFL